MEKVKATMYPLSPKEVRFLCHRPPFLVDYDEIIIKHFGQDPPEWAWDLLTDFYELIHNYELIKHRRLAERKRDRQRRRRDACRRKVEEQEKEEEQRAAKRARMDEDEENS